MEKIENLNDKHKRNTNLLFNCFSIFIITIIIWSFVFQVDIVSNAEGQIIPVGEVKTIQHLEGGIIETILVKESEIVEKDGVYKYQFWQKRRITPESINEGMGQQQNGIDGVEESHKINKTNNKEPIIYGDGEQTRDYIYVKDVVSALTKASKIDQNHFLNIGTGVETSVNDLANSMKIQFNSDINPVYKPARRGELNRSVLNNAKAKKDLEWEPEYSLDDGMKAVFNWLRT